MAEYIEKNKLLKDMHSVYTLPIFHKTNEDYMFEQMVGIVGKQPTADVVEVKHGEWICLEQEIGLYECSLCNHRMLRSKSNYCPNCGAKMKECEGK